MICTPYIGRFWGGVGAVHFPTDLRSDWWVFAVVAAVLINMCFVMTCYFSCRRLHFPTDLTSDWWVFGVAVVPVVWTNCGVAALERKVWERKSVGSDLRLDAFCK